VQSLSSASASSAIRNNPRSVTKRSHQLETLSLVRSPCRTPRAAFRRKQKGGRQKRARSGRGTNRYKKKTDFCAKVGTRTPFFKPLSASSSLASLFPRVSSFLPSPPGMPTPTALTFVPCARRQGRFVLLLPVPVPPCPSKAAACHFSLLLPRVHFFISCSPFSSPI
jgi:hypothetical protein